ncbi:DUF4864 domain-containing protein [bacterium]|nr:DUF4864 domain-containing protein [bacterium]MCI0612744.1 DUF4864 domain-containing protein [bacterium]
MDWNSTEANYPQPESGQSKDSTLLKLVIAGCGCLILIAVLFAFFAGKLFFRVMDPPRVVKAQIKALNDGNLNDAYGYFSVEYRKKHNLTSFKSDIDAFSDILPIEQDSLNRVTVENNKASVEGMLTGHNGVVFPVHYILIREKREWKIDEYNWEPPGQQQTI